MFKKVFLVILTFCLLFATQRSSAALDLVDPAIPTHTSLVYQVEESGKEFEYHTDIEVINTSEGQAYLVSTFISLGSSESEKSQTLYAKNPFLPLSYEQIYSNLSKNLYYHKAIHWDWVAREYNFEEVYQEGSKNNLERHRGSWKEHPYLDLSLAFSGLLNGLPIDENSKRTKLKLSIGRFAVDVNFKAVSTETISTAGRDWECYKIEATPDLGPLLNWVKFFFGDPKSYLWLTVSNPRLIVKAHIKTPWYERKAQLKIMAGNKYGQSKYCEPVKFTTLKED